MYGTSNITSVSIIAIEYNKINFDCVSKFKARAPNAVFGNVCIITNVNFVKHVSVFPTRQLFLY